MIDKNVMRMKLSDFHREELTDKDKYMAVAKELEADYPEAAGVFRDIAEEEKTHAHLIHHILEKM